MRVAATPRRRGTAGDEVPNIAQGPLFSLALIVLIAMLTTWIAWRLDLPSILLLLLAGFVAGPLTGWIDPDALFGDLLLPVVSIAVGIILFEGGLSLRIVELDKVGTVVFKLVTIGVVVTWAITTLAAWWLLHLSLEISVLLGAVLVVTGPTVVLPLLRQLRPKGEVGKVLKWEGILIDPIGVILAVLVAEALLVGGFQDATMTVVFTILRALTVGVLAGVAGGIITHQLLKRHWIPDHLQSPTVLGLAIGAFALAEVFQPEAGLVSATLMGVVLANQGDIAKRHVVEFKENLRVLLIGFLFIVLAARLDISDLSVVSWRSLAFLAVLVLVARPLAVIASTIGTEVDNRSRIFLSTMAPRGIVAAAISSVFAIQLTEEGIPGGEQLVPITFLVIIGTVTIYGLAAGPVSRWLGIGDPDPQGALIVGAHAWSRSFAEQLQAAGIPVKVVDTNGRRLRRAAEVGLDTYEGSLLTEAALEELDLGGIGKLVALTPNDEVNALTAVHLRELFDRSHTFQLPPATEGNLEELGVPLDLVGRFLFTEGATFSELAERGRLGWEIVTTQVPAGHEVDPLASEDRIPLALIDTAGTMTLFTTDRADEIDPQPGDRLVEMVAPDADPLPPEADEEDA